jgi:Flp pilus assembly protein TadG
MVEMAIMLPLLLLILFAIIEFGLLAGGYMIIHDLARDGVRYGVVGMSDEKIKDFIAKDEYNNDSFLNIENSDITITPATRKVGEPLKVKINYDMKISTPFIGKIIEDKPGYKTLSAEYIMRVEKLPPPPAT